MALMVSQDNSNAIAGHIWFDNSDMKYKVYTGSEWSEIQVAPAATTVTFYHVRSSGIQTVHGVDYYTFDVHQSVADEIVEWLTENVGPSDFERLTILKSRDTYGISVALRDEQDATLFTLRWI